MTGRGLEARLKVLQYDNYSSVPLLSAVLRSKHRFFPFLCSNRVIPRSRIPLQKVIASHLVKKFPAICGTRRFIAFLTTVRHFHISSQVIPVYTLRSFFKLYCNIILTPATDLQVTSSSSFPTKPPHPPSPKPPACFPISIWKAKFQRRIKRRK